jgi:hypothetical protein
MKVLFFEPFALNIQHYGTCLELMIDHLKAGDEVIFLGCNAELTTCDINIQHKPEVCQKCTERKKGGLEKISKYGRVQTYGLNQFISTTEKDALVGNYQFNDIETVKQFGFEDFTDIGFGVASSIISAERDPYPDTAVLSDTINRFIYSSKLVYRSLNNAVAQIRPERMYVYNGRYAIVRPALKIREKYAIDLFLHETGSDLSKYSLTKNHLVHIISHMQQRINDFWDRSQDRDEIKYSKAQSYFEGNKKGISKNWHSFTKDHIWELPDDWNKDDYNVVVFTSSEDEFAAIGDSWKQPIYKTQDDGIAKLANSLQAVENIKIWVRLHPNLKTAPQKLLEPYLQINSPIIRIIMPHSTISSYLLMDNADKVVTFGSSVGIEAAYWKKLSILLGMSFYKGMGAVHEANSHQEAISLILDKKLEPQDNLPASKYGYYFGNFGIPYKHFKKTGIFTGILEGWDFSTEKTPGFYQKLKAKIKSIV